jgi:prevent-host-death family protein
MVRIVNIHEAKTHLSRLIEDAVQGESFIIAKAGKPVVRVTAVDAPEPPAIRRTGFLAGQIAVPDDFDTMGREEIEQLFGSSLSNSDPDGLR